VIEQEPTRHRLSLHGLALEISCASQVIGRELARFVQPFAEEAFPAGVVPTRGFIRPYDQHEVAKHLSPKARRVNDANEPIELYEDGERFWVIDDRAGLCEINLLKNQWRTWLFPQPRMDDVRCAEFAALWPIAQLLRAKGLYLLPAAAVTRGGRGTLILSALGIESELAALVGAGYRLVGQRWTAVREEDGRIDLLHLPGRVQRVITPRLRLAMRHAAAAPGGAGWVDLAADRCAAEQHHAFCDTVLLIERGRRPGASVTRLTGDTAATLRAGWPIVELHPQRRPGVLPARLAHHCACYRVTLSRRPEALLELISNLHGCGASYKQQPFDPLAVWAA
jgi:hypothetical protein